MIVKTYKLKKRIICYIRQDKDKFLSVRESRRMFLAFPSNMKI